MTAEHDDTDLDLDLDTQPDQLGSPSPARKAEADPFAPSLDHTGNHADDPQRIANLERMRDHQRRDLARLRLTLHRMIDDLRARLAKQAEGDDGKQKAVTCSELNQLITATARLHTAERAVELMVIPAPKDDPEREEYEKLEKMSIRELRDYARSQGVDFPDLCIPDGEAEDRPGAGAA